MAINITASGSTTVAAAADGLLIQVNKDLTGTIAVATAGSTRYGTSSGTVATITNPHAGDQYRYGGLSTQGAVTVNPNGTTDITVSLLGKSNV